jgi:2-polyprenyl-3-methyl-5-hydroxy-6-metoxy-1,4-benzoquinol methylase
MSSTCNATGAASSPGASDLKARRLRAAQASGGTSGEFVYGILEKLVYELDLRGVALDLGAGIGTFTHRLAMSGRFKSIVAVDVMSRPESLHSSVRWICGDLNEGTKLPERDFDVIVAAEVIEHLENPRAFARECASLLRPGGTLILSTPNNESWRSILTLLLKGSFAAFNEYNYPAHITALLRIDIRRLLMESGFQEPRFLFTNIGTVPKAGWVTWQQLSFGILRGLRYSDNIVAISQFSPDVKPA